jgi:hypothetical protein
LVRAAQPPLVLEQQNFLAAQAGKDQVVDRLGRVVLVDPVGMVVLERILYLHRHAVVVQRD